MTTRVLFGVAHILCLLRLGTGSSIRTSIPIGYEYENQAALRPSEINRYTDKDKGLTAIKDTKYVSCFIKDYDPYWNPNEVDMREIMDTFNFQTIETDDDERKLRKRAGQVITEMCKRDRIYWATPPPPPPLNPVAGNEPVPPPIGLPEHTNSPAVGNIQHPAEFHGVQQQHGENRVHASAGMVPPPTRRRPETIKTPPPLEIYRQQHINGRLNGPMIEPPVREERDRELVPPPIAGPFHIKTPPPLEVYQRQHMNNKLDNVPSAGQKPEGSQQEKIPPSIGNAPPMRPDSPEIPPPLRPEAEAPPTIGYIPETESEVDQEPRAPPPLDFWRRMLASIKQTTTLGPPLPDMRSPEFKAKK